ncbi:hypothetical protein [Kitasatospora sp. CB02891]|uniref:hypothetical protein n=1 Tax=Kitasatospora sp. CB02891 TaxID=2020329 RepID=UPI0012FE0D85|nr:hypothetical protein [Kitasatospora sp. CB02891]
MDTGGDKHRRPDHEPQDEREHPPAEACVAVGVPDAARTFDESGAVPESVQRAGPRPSALQQCGFRSGSGGRSSAADRTTLGVGGAGEPGAIAPVWVIMA